MDFSETDDLVGKSEAMLKFLVMLAGTGPPEQETVFSCHGTNLATDTSQVQNKTCFQGL